LTDSSGDMMPAARSRLAKALVTHRHLIGLFGGASMFTVRITA
jgi:hypothetical protein